MLTRSSPESGLEGSLLFYSFISSKSASTDGSSTLSSESTQRSSITSIIQIAASGFPASVCSSYQQLGVEPVHFAVQHGNLLPVFGQFCLFVVKRVQGKKKSLVLEKAGGAACLVAYGKLASHRESGFIIRPC